jgi:hypothetical protein
VLDRLPVQAIDSFDRKEFGIFETGHLHDRKNKSAS